MRWRVLLFALLASACAFLASLDVPWVESAPRATGPSTQSLLDRFDGGVSFGGWAGPYGPAAAFELGAILVAPRLLGRWLCGPRAGDELVLLPLALLALTVLIWRVDRLPGES
jgi:hypothetical protein